VGEGGLENWKISSDNLNSFAFQCQAIVVGFLGSVVAVVMGGIKTSKFELDHAFLLCASSLVTASLASFVLGKHKRQ
jgi:solute carrier family 41